MMMQSVLTFHPHFENKVQESIQGEQWLQTLINSDDEWDISVGRYDQVEACKIFEYAQQINIKSLKMRWNQKPTIIKTIRALYLPNLKELFLNGNKIQSIQLLSSIKAPCLEVLNIKQNFITNISILNKFVSSNLKDLSIYKNQINQFGSLVYANCEGLNMIWAAGQLQIGNRTDDISWVCKLKARKIKSLIIHKQDAISTNQQKVCEKASIKYGGQLQTKYQMTDDYKLDWF